MTLCRWIREREVELGPFEYIVTWLNNWTGPALVLFTVFFFVFGHATTIIGAPWLWDVVKRILSQFRDAAFVGEVGDKVALNEVLFIGGNGEVKIGTPTVPDAEVTGEITDQGLAKKIIVFKKKRRKGYSRKRGHRQKLTTLKILEIKG